MTNSNDQITITITDDKQTTLKEITTIDVAYLKALESTLNEWNSINDNEDYADL